ncbi:unnamed protein product [Acanthoscelides obtectus]|uniref:DUF4371 domain-containing protein n=1 Tax=Acanthoscelides obtectus TaxID=200917 RepID=A0A9P0QGF8_ACAOB|nr:unnamed protein product [Acanthoscelides obtectus]CAK1627605.1 hypothetical protein AOBTE_LOCUS4700 [Acanthoscelides obtectus]
MQLLGKVDIRQQLASAYRRSIQQQNEKVRKNRGFINFTAELDIALKDHFEKSTVFKGISKIMQNELLDFMLQVAQENIRKEILEAEFVAVMADEITDVANCYQMTTVFRYIIPDGRQVERVWNFVTPPPPPPDHDAVSLSECVKTNLIQVLDKPEKLLAQSYDGASVMSGRHGGLQALIQRDYIYAYFVHCYAHQLNFILSQATSQNQEVRVFFSNLSDISTFFLILHNELQFWMKLLVQEFLGLLLQDGILKADL